MGSVDKLTVADLLSNNEYVIPLYQRNYAWGDDEIVRLLQDIEHAHGTYYLGTMVVAERHKRREIIDGQQRYTTLSLINAFLKSKGQADAVTITNLFFEARRKSRRVLEALTEDANTFLNIIKQRNSNAEVSTILAAIKIIESYFLENDSGEQDASSAYEQRLKHFTERFYKSTTLFVTTLPNGTDVNHYFEIMNTRGEQLEQHEILKAAFLDRLNDKSKSARYAEIWDACSDMGGYVQRKFSKNSREKLFGRRYFDYPDNVTIKKFLNGQVEAISGATTNTNDTRSQVGEMDKLEQIIKNHELPKNHEQNKRNDTEAKFTSIIDFPNFLLHTLRLDQKATLDDKNLLRDFHYPKINIDPEAFIIALLQLRYLFDKYVIKREWVDEVYTWSLKKVDEDTNRPTFENEEQIKLIMIQSMWNVTVSQQTNKSWLFDLLKFIRTTFEANEPKNFSARMLAKLQSMARSHFKWREDLVGLQTPRYVFYFLEYALWSDYYDKVRGFEKEKENWPPHLKKIFKLKNKFNTFSFSQRNSIEHLYPQSRVNDLETTEGTNNQDLIDKFGNLCLISRNSNSFFSDDLPEQKKVNSKKRNLNESLKQAIMFESFSGMVWGAREIEVHHDEMMKILNSYYKN